MKDLIKDIKMVITSNLEESFKDKTIEKLIIDFTNEKKAFSLSGVGCSLPTKEEIDLEANKQAMFKNIWGEERQSLSKYQGFMNCVNWYAEKMKK